MAFKPNTVTFAQGVQRAETACKASGLDLNSNIVTSRDSKVKKVLSDLMVANVPKGFTKVQLPVVFDGPSQTYMSFGAPNTKVPLHSHDEGAGIRVIMFGSIVFNGQELSAGDWMYIPAGKKYEFEVGPMGVGVFYCYRCCCV